MADLFKDRRYQDIHGIQLWKLKELAPNFDRLLFTRRSTTPTAAAPRLAVVLAVL